MKKFLPGVFLILSLFYFLSPKNVLAKPQINISSYPSEVVAGEPFKETVMVKLEGLVVSAVYRVKSLGGETKEFDGLKKVYTLYNSKELAWNADWDLMPEVTADNEGKASVEILSKFYTNSTPGNNYYLIRIRKKDDDKNYDSDSVSINVLPPLTPTPTEIPTPTPTFVPTATKTPSPTKTPTPPKEPTSTKTPTPQSTVSSTSNPTNTPVPPTLKTTVLTLKPTPKPKVLGEEKIATISAKKVKSTITGVVKGTKTSSLKKTCQKF